jgi:hypothetical protein
MIRGEKPMKDIDLAEVIEDVISKFSQNRAGTKPTVFVTIPPELPHIHWRDDGLEKFIRALLYDALLMDNPEAPIRVTVRRRARLKDLQGFIGINPLCWIQLSIAGRGLRLLENLVEDRFKELGYCCEEWIGVQGSGAQLAIFCAAAEGAPKMVFCVDATQFSQKWDLLIPVLERLLLPFHSSSHKKI